MSVEILPAELGFRRPFTTEVSQTLSLRNPTTDPMAFKVKTTAPKQYCVRPNSGRIEPGQQVDVQVLLQAMKEDPPMDYRCRDKFLVQSVSVTADKEFNNVASIWSHIEQTNKSSILEKKIRVVFLPPNGPEHAPLTPQSGVNGVRHSTPSQQSMSPEAVTPSNRTSVTPSGPVSSIDSRPSDARSLGDSVNSTYNPASETSTVTAVANSVSNAIPTSTEDLKAQLTEARNTITRLREQAEQGLRQRTGANVNTDSKEKGTTSTTAMLQQAPVGGVSVQITAALCLISFLLAYFFF